MIDIKRTLPKPLQAYVLAAVGFAAIYAVYLLAVSPQHEFPLNDDWAYAQTVRHLLDTGQLRLSDWTATTLIFQTYWGALLARLGGDFSFTALRWSTLLFSYICSLALFDLLRQLDFTDRHAFLGAVVLVVNPLFIYLSYTFMSEIFFLGLMLLSLTCYVRGIKRDAPGVLLLGAIFAAGAYLARQLGVVLPIAAAVAIILAERRLVMRKILAVTGIPLAVFVVHTYWLTNVHGLPWGMQLNAIANSWQALQSPDAVPQLFLRLSTSWMYLGLFTLPILLPQAFKGGLRRVGRARAFKIFVVWLGVLTLLTLLFSAQRHQPFMPYWAGVIQRDGFGPSTLAGHKPPITPDWVFLLVTIVAPVAGAAQAALWTEATLQLGNRQASSHKLLVLAGLLMAGITALIVLFWDRYLLVFVPASIFLALKLGPISGKKQGVTVALCVALAVYALIGLGDYFSWNTARWIAGEQIVAQGVPPETIDGGFEWNGWYRFETALPQAIAAGKGEDLFGWLKLTSDQYIMAYEPLDGLPIMSRVEYAVPLSDQRRFIYVLAVNGP
jgi:4-amino-4-deoxy-L-arabinose transferase-like glycosyltransferase